MVVTKHTKAHFHYTLHAGRELELHISRTEAERLVKRWAGALRKNKRGHRTYFILHAHMGRTWNRLSVTTHAHAHRERKARESALPAHQYPFRG
jgi:hypothetical protein